MSKTSSTAFPQARYTLLLREAVTASGVNVVIRGAMYQNIYEPGTPHEFHGEYWYWYSSAMSADGGLRGYTQDDARHNGVGMVTARRKLAARLDRWGDKATTGRAMRRVASTAIPTATSHSTEDPWKSPIGW